MAVRPDIENSSGDFLRLEGEDVYRIAQSDQLPPFLINLASDSDLWMFISSRGGLTAGRVDAEGALFEYQTVDKLHDAHHYSGPLTLFRVRARGRQTLWQPFDPQNSRQPEIERNLYKNVVGNRLMFEEIHHDLALAFRYRWAAADEWGWIRTCTVENRSSNEAHVAVLDGLRNVMPFGAPLTLHQTSSTLIDAYKRSELDDTTKLGLFRLTAKIIDRPEAQEELRVNSVWCHGLAGFDASLSSNSIDALRYDHDFVPETLSTGQRGNYFVRSEIRLAPDSRIRWHIVTDVGLGHGQVAALRARLAGDGDLSTSLEHSLASASDNLTRNVASADGLQLTRDRATNTHHFANVLFNNMRGGVFPDNYDIPTADLVDFLWMRNRSVAGRRKHELQELPDQVSIRHLHALAAATEDLDFQRLAHEYLPLYFSRRHGDPSRPWNRFSVRVRDERGARSLQYEGNWRDIFQNWEALTHSFPCFLPSIIAKFVNASTIDGFNPYRLTRDGFEWEVEDPRDPWSHIGYWGDHQIVYLLRLLEQQWRFAPAVLCELLTREIFCYADVPYRLASYPELLQDPHDTIAYDDEAAAQIEFRVGVVGADGQLVPDANGLVYHVNLLEKILVPALSKLSNFVPGAGIWMNTQRPEWNDANNALAGHGVSAVTLCHVRRYLEFLERVLTGPQIESVEVSSEVVAWLRDLAAGFDATPPRVADSSSATRKRLLDTLGTSFSVYRERVYGDGFSHKDTLPLAEIVAFVRLALEHVDHAVRANRREDGLFHAYNILEFTDNRETLRIHRLYEMLEGQVAALSSGVLDATEAIELLSSLFDSRMYRVDQKSFLLYPQKDLPRFVDKNRIPEDLVESVPLFGALLEEGDRSVVIRDELGAYRFHADFKNARDLDAALGSLAEHQRWTALVQANRQLVLDAFETVFEHRYFTGRSATMYGFEGLGCVYWHMVAKLLLAAQEVALAARANGQPQSVQRRLLDLYRRIRDGFGFRKSPLEYGAFPTDPYSHTPAHAGAQQPGMTGQVKEEILTRFGELGVRVENGRVQFRPWLLARNEFLARRDTYTFYDAAGNRRSIEVPAETLVFSFCQVPVVYELVSEPAWIRVTLRDGCSTVVSDELGERHSRMLFERSGEIERLDVGIPESSLETE